MNFLDQIKLHRQRRFEEETTRFENALALRLMVLETVVDTSGDGVLITDALLNEDGPRVQYVNTAFTHLTGYAAETIIGKSVSSIWDLPENSANLVLLHEAYAALRPITTEMHCKRTSGEPLWVELITSPLFTEDGTCQHWIHVQRDITDRKAREELMLRAKLAEEQNEKLVADVMRHKALEMKLMHDALHEPLTGLKNRAYFMDRLAQSLERAGSRGEYCGALLYLDLDNFKKINDTYGHHAGDKVLIEVGRRLELCSRPQDTVCRMGGDEFTVLLDDIKTMDAAYAVAKRIVERMKLPVLCDGIEINVGASIGVSDLTSKHESAEHAVRESDIAMYRAKRAGGEQFAIAQRNAMITDPLPQKFVERREEDALRYAMDQGELELFYQPVIELQTLRAVQVETFLRWRHPERGLLLSGEILAIAKATNLIIPVGLLLFRAACLQLREWHRLIEFRDVTLSINVSKEECFDKDFFENVVETLIDTETDPRNIQFEIEQDVLHSPPEHSPDLFHRLRRMGIQIGLVNFRDGDLKWGENNSDHLVDMLKVKYNLRRIPILEKFRTESKAASSKLPSLCVEQIETLEQHATLLSQNISFAQGDLYSPPLPADEATKILVYGVRLPHFDLRACG